MNAGSVSQRATHLPFVFAALTLILAMALVGFQLSGNHGLAAIAKMLGSACFVGVAISCGGLRSAYGRLIIIGLLFSVAGDALLLPQWSAYFLYGLVSFLLAHVLYIAAFVKVGLSRHALLRISPAVIVMSGLAIVWLTPFIDSDLKLPVYVYTAVISLMVISAFGARATSLLIPAGAALFYFSDLSVAAGRFVDTDFPNYVWGLPFYYAGQVLLALSVRSGAPEN